MQDIIWWKKTSNTTEVFEMKYKIHLVKLFKIQNTLKCLKYVGLFEIPEVGPYV